MAKYVVNSIFEFYYPSDNVGMVAFNKKSRDTFFIKFSGNKKVKKLFGSGDFSIAVLNLSLNDPTEFIEVVIPQLIQRKIIKEF